MRACNLLRVIILMGIQGSSLAIIAYACGRELGDEGVVKVNPVDYNNYTCLSSMKHVGTMAIEFHIFNRIRRGA